MRAGSGLLAVAVALGSALPLGAREVAVREIRVERPGVVSVELGAEELVRLGDVGAVEVVGPQGERRAAERRLARAEAPCRAVEIAAVERRAEGYLIGIRVPAGAGEHGALDFELDQATLAPGCRVEELLPGGGWLVLAQGDLFRVGEGETLARTRLTYPATAARELRLVWPESAGYPKVRAARICAPERTRAPLELPARAAREEAPPGRARFELALPPRAVRLAALDLALPAAPAGDLGWRVSFGQQGRWRELAHGLWPGRSLRQRIELGDVAFAGRALRLELLGEPVDEPAATWELAPQVVRFEAERAGVWTLRWPAGETGGALPLAETPAEFAPGAPRVETLAWAPPPAGAVAPALAGGRRFAIDGNGARSGAPVSLELPPELLGAAGGRAADLRLVAGGRQVPARIEELPEPRTVEILPALTPHPLSASTSALEIDLGAGAADAGGAGGIVLEAARAARPFGRAFLLTAFGGAAGPDRPIRLGRHHWDCSGAADDACEVFLDPPPRGCTRLRLEFEDGDSAPLAGLAAERLARRWHVVFQWPAAAPELIVGGGAPVAAFDLAALDAALAVAPPVPVRLGALLSAAGASADRWGRPLLIAGIVLAALALLLLLRRLLPAAAGRG